MRYQIGYVYIGVTLANLSTHLIIMGINGVQACKISYKRRIMRKIVAQLRQKLQDKDREVEEALQAAEKLAQVKSKIVRRP